MKIKSVFALLAGLLSSAMVPAATPSINELNSCLALVEFVDVTLPKFADHHPPEDMTTVHKGLEAYKIFLRDDVVTVQLVNMYGGNEAQAKLMQILFARQKKTFFKHLEERYSEKKLLTEYAAAINDCTAKARVPSEVAKPLKAALNTMILMARRIQ